MIKTCFGIVKWSSWDYIIYPLLKLSSNDTLPFKYIEHKKYAWIIITLRKQSSVQCAVRFSTNSKNHQLKSDKYKRKAGHF